MSLLQSLNVIKPGHRSYTPTLDLRFADDMSLTPRIGYAPTFTRSSTAYRYNSSGSLESMAIDAPRLDYDPVTLTCHGLLMEPQATNYVLRSEAPAGLNSWFTYTSGSAPAPTLTPEFANAPNGQLKALRIQADVSAAGAGDEARAYVSVDVLPSLATISASVYLKSNTANNQVIRITNRGGGNPTLVTVTPEWQRFSPPSLTPTSTIASQLRFSLVKGETDDTCDVLLWGAMLEQGSVPTSMIDTAGSTATRSADVLSLKGTELPSTFRDDGPGTVIVDHTPRSSQINNRIWNIQTGDAQNRIALYTPSPGEYRILTTIDGANAARSLGSSPVVGQRDKVAVAWNGSTTSGALNGTAIASVALAAPMSKGMDDLYFNLPTPSAAHYVRFTYYRDELPESVMQELTAP